MYTAGAGGRKLDQHVDRALLETAEEVRLPVCRQPRGNPRQPLAGRSADRRGQGHSSASLTRASPSRLSIVASAALYRSQPVLIHVTAHLTSLLGPALLVETEMNTAVDPCVVDVGRDLVESRVFQNDPGLGRTRHGDGMSALAEDAFQHFTCAVACTRMPGRIAGETRRHDERHV